MKRILLSLMVGSVTQCCISSIALVSMQGRAIANEYSQSNLADTIRQKASIPVLLPNEEVIRQGFFDSSERVYEYSRASDKDYHVTFSQIPNCDANACLRFSVGGTRGKSIDTTLPNTKGASSEYVRLSDGSKALAKKQCGASCWGVVQWKSNGVLYEVWTKARNYQAAIAIANSMVKASDRSKASEKATTENRTADLVAVSNWQWSIFEDIRIPDFPVSKK